MPPHLYDSTVEKEAIKQEEVKTGSASLALETVPEKCKIGMVNVKRRLLATPDTR